MSITKFEVLPIPIKSESDIKQYKVIKLKNGLVALLISDTSKNPKRNGNSEENSTNESKAAASLCVGVGSFSDPKEVPGMSHFLEHMVSMGSEKYPGENDFESFIQRSGGETNAATDAEVTTFYFNIFQNNLNVALDKFAQFFIAPLMKKEAISREREAVDSEFEMNVKTSDEQRQEMLKFSFAKPNSPMNFFSCGNLKTLKDDISEEKLYEKVHEYRQRHYSAHRMTLAIQACLPIETLQNSVVEYFSNIPNNNLPQLDYTEYSKEIFDTPEFNKIYYLKPVKEVTKLNLTWSLPPIRNKYRNKPLDYVATLIGDEGKGSLLSYLKKKLWSTSVMCDESDYSSYATFSIAIVLTEDGLNHVYDVIEAVFSYIKLMKSTEPQKRIFDEIKMVNDATFRFKSEETATENVKELSENMLSFPPQDYIGGVTLLYEFDPEVIKLIQNKLVPNRVNIIITTKKLPEGLEFNKVEKWLGAEYVGVDISQDVKNKWEAVELNQEFKIPLPNPFLSNNFDILPQTTNNPEYPQKILSNNKYELWYRQDQKFKRPEAYYYIYLLSSSATESARSATLLNIFCDLIKFYFNEEAYPSKLANLEYNINSNTKGILFKVSGFHEKIPVLINAGVKHIKNLKQEINEEAFKEVKAKLLKSFYNILLSPEFLASNGKLKLLVNFWTYLDKYNALLDITFEDMTDFIEDYLKSLYVKVLVQGNVLEDVAKDVTDQFVNYLGFNVLSKDKYPKFSVAQLPIGEKCLILSSFNENDVNSITVNSYQIGLFTVKNVALTNLMMTIIEEPLFDVLRTKEQLGYQVSGTSVDTFGTISYSIKVYSQATKFTTQHLDSRIEEFLKQTKNILEEMSVQEYERIKGDYIKALEEKDIQLKEEADRNWSEISEDYYTFDRSKQVVQSLKNLKLDEIKTWWNKLNRYGGKENFRKLSVQVEGHSPKVGPKSGDNLKQHLSWNILSNKNKKSDYYINNVETFRSTLQLYSSDQKSN